MKRLGTIRSRWLDTFLAITSMRKMQQQHELIWRHDETCIKSHSSPPSTHSPPPSLTVFLPVPFKIPSKVSPSSISPLTKMLDGELFHVAIWRRASRGCQGRLDSLIPPPHPQVWPFSCIFPSRSVQKSPQVQSDLLLKCLTKGVLHVTISYAGKTKCPQHTKLQEIQNRKLA